MNPALKRPSRHELRQRWYGIVQEYSRRALSNPKDRLPAIAGFAAEWKRYQPKDEYLAGLWKNDIRKGLLWFPGRDLRNIRRPLPDTKADPATLDWPPTSLYPGIPSWSWAAFNGGVVNFGDRWLLTDPDADMTDSVWRDRYPLQIHHASTTIVGKNMYGHVAGGQITLSSWCMNVTVSEETNFRPDLGPRPGSLAVHNSSFARSTNYADELRQLNLNHNKADDVDGPKRYYLFTDTDTYNGVLLFDYDPVHLPEIQVLLVQAGLGVNFRGSLSAVCGLVLMPATTITVGDGNRQQEASGIEQSSDGQVQYKRVGIFDLIDGTTWMKKRENKVITVV